MVGKQAQMNKTLQISESKIKYAMLKNDDKILLDLQMKATELQQQIDNYRSITQN